jgi:hypothetical protein
VVFLIPLVFLTGLNSAFAQVDIPANTIDIVRNTARLRSALLGQPAPTLGLSITGQESVTSPTQEFTAAWTVTNTGATTLTKVVVTVPLPDMTTFGNIAPGGVIVLPLGEVLAGMRKEISVTLHLISGVQANGLLVRAVVSAEGAASASAVTRVTTTMTLEQLRLAAVTDLDTVVTAVVTALAKGNP